MRTRTTITIDFRLNTDLPNSIFIRVFKIEMYCILFCERGTRDEVDCGRVLLNLHSSIAIVLFIFIGDHEMKRIQIQLFLVMGLLTLF